MRRLKALLAGGAVLLLGAAALPGSYPSPFRPRAAGPDGPGVRERYRVRVNGTPMTLERSWSPLPPEVPADAVRFPVRGGIAAADADGAGLIAHPAAGGWTVWRGSAPRFPIGTGGADPGGVRPPRALRRLALESDREDALAAGFYETAAGPEALRAALEAEGWRPLGGGLWTRGAERLIADADDRRPGTALVYWRLPGETP